VVINLVCYRRLGHNEQDDPSITLPLLASRIERHPRVAHSYAARLVADGDATEAEVSAWRAECEAEYDEQYRQVPVNGALHVSHPQHCKPSFRYCVTTSRVILCIDIASIIDLRGPKFWGASQYVESAEDWVVSNWHGNDGGTGGAVGDEDGAGARKWHNPRTAATGVPLRLLRAVGVAATSLPDMETIDANHGDGEGEGEASTVGFVAHPHVRRLLASRRAMVQEATAGDERGGGDAAGAGGHPVGVDWAMGELLAFGSLLLHRGGRPAPDGTEGDRQPHCHVRLSGQDVERGTFNHRHSVLYCSRSSRPVTPLAHLGLGPQDLLMVANSPLSEHAILGFEYGFSVDAGPSALVLWEAQFGDFANNAQCVVDQFITTGEAKWGQRSGLVLLLPHGHDGMGPDHSSARPERWLAAANDDADSLPGRSPRWRLMKSARRPVRHVIHLM